MTRFITTLSTDSRIRALALTGYYLAVLGALLVLATRGAFTTPSFVYQGF